MANFKIGQLVKIVRTAFPENEGRVGVVTNLDGGCLDSRTGFTIAEDGHYWVDCGNDLVFACKPWQLEPLTDSGQKEIRAEDILALENLSEGPKRDAIMQADMAKAWASDRY